MDEKSKVGTAWLSFLYGLFVFQCILLPISILSAVGQIKTYTHYYGSYGTLLGILYLAIFADIIRVIIKICACVKKYTESGYSLFIACLILDTIGIIFNGFCQSASVGLISIFIGAIVLIPNMIYITKRKHLYVSGQPNYTPNDFQSFTSQKEYKCGNCGKIGPYDGNCPDCGSSIKVYFDEEIVPKNKIGNNVESNIADNENLKKCDMCEMSSYELISAKIVDSMGTRYRNLCPRCMAKCNAIPVEKKDKQTSNQNSQVKFCRKCGHKLAKHSLFCSECGTKIVESNE